MSQPDSIQRQKKQPEGDHGLAWLRFGAAVSLACVIGGMWLISFQHETASDVSARAKIIIPARTPSVTEVNLNNLQFVPVTIEIKTGDTIEWKNNDLVAHTATTTLFDSGMIASGQTWRYTFKQAGNYPYACAFHPQMKGVVVVK